MSARARRYTLTVIAAAVVLLSVVFLRGYGRGLWHPYYRQMTKPRTVPAVLAEIGPTIAREPATLKG